MLGAICLYGICADVNIPTQVYTAATKRDQAKIIFNYAAEMAKNSKHLNFLKLYRSGELCNFENNSVIKSLSRDYNTLDGLLPHISVIDELHAHNDRGMWDVLDTTDGASNMSMLIVITTAGEFGSEKICIERRNLGIKVLEGVLKDEKYFFIDYCADDHDDFESPKTWEKANPNLDVTISKDYLRAKMVDANYSPNVRANFLSKHLNVWVQSNYGWIDDQIWMEGGGEKIDLEKIQQCEYVYAGLDLSSTNDFTALVLAGFLGEKIYIYPFFGLVKKNIMINVMLLKKAIELGKKQNNWKLSKAILSITNT